jgi:hypothetical protein
MNPGGYAPPGGMHSPSGHGGGSQKVRRYSIATFQVSM